jgi:hypothetical protein
MDLDTHTIEESCSDLRRLAWAQRTQCP